MMEPPLPEARDDTRAEIAALAAGLIVDSGLDFHAAKLKAARQVVGDSAAGRLMPDNDLVDRFLLEHLELFDNGHAARVERYRQAAVHWMQRLADFHPYVTGAAWKGIATRHAPIHLQVFTDDAKDLEVLLIDAHVNYDVGELGHFANRGLVPALTFWWQRDLPILLSVYRYDDLRGALKRVGNGPSGFERGSLEALQRVLQTPDSDAAAPTAPAGTPGPAR